MQVYAADLRAEGTEGQDRRASEGQLLQTSGARGDLDVRGYFVCVR